VIIPCFEGAVVTVEPFPHIRIPQILSRTFTDEVLGWLRDEAAWSLRVESFYEQHEISLQRIDLPPCVSPLTSPAFIGAAAGALAKLFGELGGLRLADISAHRLSGGQTIKIHNDFIGDEESHRLLIQLNAGWGADHGGFLMLFGGSDPSDLRNVVPPIHGSGFAFEISPRSHHAVSSTVRGERFTVVYTFRRNGAPIGGTNRQVAQ
jgi:Rps23 Pro-64 3,4-dihydroxylase Tpa1-like proline 4-hydroxylase